MVLAGSRHETTRDNVEVQLSGATLEAVHYFQPGRPLRPFVFGGFGLVYFVSRDFAFTFNARADAINWNQASGTVTLPGGGVLTVDQPVDEGGLAAKFGVGMGWWF